MEQFGIYWQVILALWDLLIGSLHATMYICMTILAANKLCLYCGVEPVDPAILADIGEKWMDKITAPIRTRGDVFAALSSTHAIVFMLVTAVATVVFTTIFQVVTISTAAGLSLLSARFIGSTFDLTTVSIYLIAISMLLALSLFTYINDRTLNQAQYA